MYEKVMGIVEPLTTLELLSTPGLWRILSMFWIPAIVVFVAIIYILNKTKYRSKHCKR